MAREEQLRIISMIIQTFHSKIDGSDNYEVEREQSCTIVDACAVTLRNLLQRRQYKHRK